MNELKQKLMDQLGLDESKSDSAIQMVIGFVKDKLPDSVSGMLDGVLGGDDDDSDGGSPLDKIKGLF